MKLKEYHLKDGEVIEEVFEVSYDFENLTEFYIGQITRVQTKLSERVCDDPKILEMFQRKEQADEKYKARLRRLFNPTGTAIRPRDTLSEVRKNKQKVIFFDGRIRNTG